MRDIPVSIVMTYFERRKQLENTLGSFAANGYTDCEVIIVDDGSVEQPLRPNSFPALGLPVRIITMPPTKDYTNPCVPFNRGFRAAKGEIIVIQNAECAHLGDLLRHARERLTRGSYFSYACYSLSRERTSTLEIKTLEDLSDLRRWLADQSASSDGADGWYNHSVYRPAGYHFASAIRRDALDRLGGFDERYAQGIAFDDDELLDRVRRSGLRLHIVDEPCVAHQWHSGVPRLPTYQKLYTRNLLLHRLVTRHERTWRAGARTPRYLLYRAFRGALVELYLAYKAMRSFLPGGAVQ